MASSRTRFLRWGAPAALLLLLFLTHVIWLRALGSFLVASQEPFKADMVVVLAGDDSGNRIIAAARLVKDGYAPAILVSGPCCCYGHPESELAIDFAVQQGCPRGWFIPFPIHGDSTVAEAEEIVPELNRRRVGRFIVVTSNYHTRRAANAYRRLVPRDRFRMVAAPDLVFHPRDWWRNRSARKVWFLEWTKTIASWAGL